MFCWVESIWNKYSQFLLLLQNAQNSVKQIPSKTDYLHILLSVFLFSALHIPSTHLHLLLAVLASFDIIAAFFILNQRAVSYVLHHANQPVNDKRPWLTTLRPNITNSAVALHCVIPNHTSNRTFFLVRKSWLWLT